MKIFSNTITQSVGIDTYRGRKISEVNSWEEMKEYLKNNGIAKIVKILVEEYHTEVKENTAENNNMAEIKDLLNNKWEELEVIIEN